MAKKKEYKDKNRHQKDELFQTWRNRIGLDVKAESMPLGTNYSTLGRGFTENNTLDDELESYQEKRPMPEDEVMDNKGRPVESFKHKMNRNRAGQYDDYNMVNVIHPLRLLRPTNLKELKDAVDYAARNGFKIKAVGSGHSYSDMTVTSDFLVKTDFLNSVLIDDTKDKGQIRHYRNLKESVKSYINKNYTSNVANQENATPLNQEDKLTNPAEIIGKDPVDGDPYSLYEIEAGIKIRDLNKELHSEGKTLINMGTYQGQAFMGAVATSTHGSGILLPPLPDMIISMVLVATVEDKKNNICKAKVYRIEPTNGITKPGTKDPEIDELIQNDEIFNAALVNMGCFGIVYSLIIRVRPPLYIIEEVEWTTWEVIKKELERDYKVPNTPLSDKTVADRSNEKNDLFRRKTRKKLGNIGPETEYKDIEKNHNPYTAIRNLEIYINPHKVNEDGKSTKIDANDHLPKSGGTPKPKGGHNFCRIVRRYKASPDEITYIQEQTKNFRTNTTGKEFAFTREPKPGTTARNAANEKIEFLTNHTAPHLNKLKDLVNGIPEWMNKFVVFRTEHPRGQAIADYAFWRKKLYPQKVKDTMNSPNKRYTSEDLYGNINFRLYLAGGDRIGGYGAEMGFNFNSKKHIEAVDTLIATAEKGAYEGLHVQTTIISMRFVAGSTAYLSPQYSSQAAEGNDPTVMLELLMLNDTHGGKEILYRYQIALLKIGGRPHWGLEFNVLTGNNETLQKLYGRTAYDTWKKAYQLFNQGGVFDNRFTNRMGFSGLID